MSDNRFMMLQFFADGAAGSDGGEGAASTGDNAADAGRDLEALGVPREYAERHKQRMDRKRGKAAPAAGQAEPRGPIGDKGAQGMNAITGEKGTEDSAPAANDGGNEWDAFFSKQENKDKLQQMMAERGKAATEAKNAANAQIEKLSPMLRILGEKYGVKPNEDGSFDLDAISKAVSEDDSYFEDKALEMGVSVDVARKLEQADALEQQQKQAEEKAKRAALLQEHFNRVQEQAKAVQEIIPGFDLNQAMQDPEFVRRTAPGMIPADEAYIGMHYREILKRKAAEITQRSKQAAAANVAAGGSRPRENGSAAMATASATPDMRAMSPQERRAYIMRKYPKRT